MSGSAIIHTLHSSAEKPERFTYPFCYEPHPLCLAAAEEVKQEIATMPLTEGKMFGVLVVETAGGLAFLAAYSGLLEGRNDWPYFVPPVFDAQQPDGYFKTREREITLVARSSGKEGAGVEATTSKEMSQDLLALPSVSAAQCTGRDARPRRHLARLPLFTPHPPAFPPAPGRHRRLLCTQAPAIRLQPPAQARLHGRVLVGTFAKESHPSSRPVLPRLSR